MTRRILLILSSTLLALFVVAWMVSFQEAIWYRTHADEYVGSFGLKRGYFFWERRETWRLTSTQLSLAQSQAREARRFPLLESYWLQGATVRSDPPYTVIDVRGDAGWRVALWPGVVLCSTFLLLAAFIGYRKRQLLRERVCRVCGHDLTGNTDPVCPGCGVERRSRPASYQTGAVRRLARYVCLFLIAVWAISGLVSVDIGIAGGSIGAGLSHGALHFRWYDTQAQLFTSNCSIGYHGYTFQFLPQYFVASMPQSGTIGSPRPPLGQYHSFIIPLFPLAVMSAVVATALLVFRTKRASDSFCNQCGYDLTGNLNGRCPECGTQCPYVSVALTEPVARARVSSEARARGE